jgi:GMP synthase (glutamine-hydrolysing)
MSILSGGLVKKDWWLKPIGTGKDEVRQVARTLGIEESVAGRQPFPGPGLAIRMICYDGENKITEQEYTDFQKLLTQYAGGYHGQLLPIKSVGVQGDCRSYRYLSVINGKGLEFDWEKVYAIGKNLPNQVNFINRVAYCLNKTVLPGEIKSYPMYINKENVNLLRELDAIVVSKLNIPPISQVFAVLLPVGITKKFSVGIRTFVTNDFMTGRPAFIGEDIPKELIAEIVHEIESKFPEIDLVLYDVTSKPPATVEWQ